MNQHHQAQWVNVVPKKVLESEDGPEGRAVLLVPRFRKGPLAKWLQPRLRRPHIRVKLDELGSFVWSKIDGERDFNAICHDMKERFGENLSEPEDRLQKFLCILQKNDFVRLFTISDPETR